ncbi:hypothetical protein F7C95_04375 [Opitutia bacterium ISCC 51]|nr:hypothetical protein F7C95_04375 [Opitutae bacterium ISCC 51]QXD29213.1 hypothetical protein GA003_04355 [Opitutae bacterium ISCC 52]
MKKTFPLEAPNKKTPRVIDSIKHEVNKYVKRERNKKLPEGMHYWDFDCRVGTDSESAETTHIKTISKAIDSVTESQSGSVYVEVQAKAMKRGPKKVQGDKKG